MQKWERRKRLAVDLQLLSSAPTVGEALADAVDLAKSSGTMLGIGYSSAEGGLLMLSEHYRLSFELVRELKLFRRLAEN